MRTSYSSKKKKINLRQNSCFFLQLNFFCTHVKQIICTTQSGTNLSINCTKKRLDASSFPHNFSFSRIERVNLSEGSSKMKILGTVISVAGAVSMAFYKGRCLVHRKSVGHVYHSGATNKSSVSGFFLLLGSFSSWSSYMILQVSCDL